MPSFVPEQVCLVSTDMFGLLDDMASAGALAGKAGAGAGVSEPEVLNAASWAAVAGEAGDSIF